MATKLSKSAVEEIVKSGKVKDMDALYRKLYKKGKDATAPAAFVSAVETVCGGNPFAPKVKKVKTPKAAATPKTPKPISIKIGKRAVRAAVREGAADMASLHAAIGGGVEIAAFEAAVNKAFPDGDTFIVKAKAVKEKQPKTTPFRVGSKYQRLLELCISGGGNGKTVVEVADMAVAAGIVAYQHQGMISLSVLRNPAQFSNRGRVSCANYADAKRTPVATQVVNLSVLSLTATMPDRYGKVAAVAEQGAAPSPEGGNEQGETLAPTTSGESGEGAASETPAPAAEVEA